MLSILQTGNVVTLSASMITWLEGDIDCIINARNMFIPPVICWVASVSRIIFVIVVGECKYLEIRATIILGDMNIDVEVLMVCVEVSVFGIDSMWLILYFKFRRHLHTDVDIYIQMYEYINYILF